MVNGGRGEAERSGDDCRRYRPPFAALGPPVGSGDRAASDGPFHGRRGGLERLGGGLRRRWPRVRWGYGATGYSGEGQVGGEGQEVEGTSPVATDRRGRAGIEPI